MQILRLLGPRHAARMTTLLPMKKEEMNLVHLSSAADYNELQKDRQASCEVSYEGIFISSKEHFQAAEIFFSCKLEGACYGFASSIALCMDHCAEAELADDGWFKTVVLAGGTACLPGLPDMLQSDNCERMEKEMQKLLPSFISEGINVLLPLYGVDSAWFGVKIISNVSTFSAAWCVTRKQFRQESLCSATSFFGPWW